MITRQTSLETVPESILKKWETKDLERAKKQLPQLTYAEGVTYMVPEDTDDLNRIVFYLLANAHKIIGFDTEATSNRPESADIVGMSFAVDNDKGFYIPVGHAMGGNLDIELVFERLTQVFQSKLSMAGGKFDWHLMKRHGVDIKYGVDSQIMSRLLGEVEYGVGLKPTVERMFEERMIEFTDVVKPAALKRGESFANIEVSLGAMYAVPDAIYTRRVSRFAMLNMPEAIKKFLLGVEHEVMRIAGEMEYVGVPLDEEFLAEKLKAGRSIVNILKEETIEGLRDVAERRGHPRKEIPEDLNLNSSPQMQRALFDVCGFKPVRKSKKTGKPSADKASIKKMAEREPEVDWVRRYRSAQARVHDLEEMMDFGLHDHGWLWLHGSLNPTGAATGRWSSREPNLQNIKKGVSTYESLTTTWEVAARDAICSPPGWYIVTADYSQVELRVAAGESQCRAWLEAFRNGDDIHSASGSAIYKVPIGDVTSKQRADGKTYNFALLFGQEVKSTAEALGVSVAEAQRMQNAFWEGLPEVKSWIDRVHATVRVQKYIETKFGRRRWLRGVDSDNKWIALENYRESVNTIVQGTAADILKIGLTRQEIVAERHGAKLFLVVHDQYVWLVPEGTRPDVFCQDMDEVINFAIPGYPEILSDYGIGKRFDSLVSFDHATDVPQTWDEVFQQSESSTASETEESLHIEVPNVTVEELAALTELVTQNEGSREIILAVTERGIEKPMLIRTSLGIEDELKIRAAVGAAARVTLV